MRQSLGRRRWTCRRSWRAARRAKTKRYRSEGRWGVAVKDQNREYARKGSAVFCKTDEEFGGLSNMAAGFPLVVNGVPIRTSEALYQACRFPHLSDVQRLIIDQKSPMTAKMKSKPHRAN